MSIPTTRQFKSLLDMVIEGPTKKRPIEHDFLPNIRIRYREANMLNVDPTETFEASLADEDEAIAEAIDAISDLDAHYNGDNDNNDNDARKPSVGHVTN